MRALWLIVMLGVSTLFACGGGPEGGSATDEALEGASDVARDAVDAWTENAEGIASYTVTTETGGQEMTETYVKQMVNGMPVFLPEGAQAQDAMAQLPQLLASAREEGEGDVGGEATHILVVDDAAALNSVFNAEGGPFQPSRLEIHVGQDDHLMRQLRVSGQATIPGGAPRDVTNIVLLEDWREVEGFAYPFRTTTRIEGLSDMMADAASQMDAAQAEMEAQIAQLPESQREAARQAMAAQMEAARQATSGDAMETVTTVRELQVTRE